MYACVIIYYHYSITATTTIITNITTNTTNTNTTNTYTRVLGLIFERKCKPGKPHQFPAFSIKTITLTSP